MLTISIVGCGAAYNSDEWETAVHEAAHALSFDAFGIILKTVSVRGETSQKADVSGFVEVGAPSPNGVALVGALAGPAASLYLAGAWSDLAFEERFRTDTLRLQEIFHNQTEPQDPDEYWRGVDRLLNGWVKRWVLKHSQEIGEFARVLLENGILAGQELQDRLQVCWGGNKPQIHALLSDATRAIQEAFAAPSEGDR